MNQFSTFHAVILAAGKGTRLKEAYDLPKPLLPLEGKAGISYVLEKLEDLHIEISIVVKHRKEDIIDSLGNKYEYVEQNDEKGTGAAIRSVIDTSTAVEYTKNILVLNADDSAFLTQSTLQKFMSYHEESESDVTVLSVYKSNPKGLGRIMKKEGFVTSIIEEKDATEHQRTIQEVNTGIFCFKNTFLQNYVKKIKPSNVTNEYYITELVSLAVQNGYKVSSFQLQDDAEVFGFNTVEQYKQAQRKMKEILKK